MAVPTSFPGLVLDFFKSMLSHRADKAASVDEKMLKKLNELLHAVQKTQKAINTK